MDDPNDTISSPNLVGLIKSWIPWRSEPSYVSRDFWMPDRSCRVCYECDSLFTFFNRRHHCRLCGRIFCAKCASHWLPAPSGESLSFLQHQDWDTPTIRVCDYCHKQWQLEAKNGACVVADLDLIVGTSSDSFISVKSSDEDSSSSTFLSLSQSAEPSPNQTLAMDTTPDAGGSPGEKSNDSIMADNWSQSQLGPFQNWTKYDRDEQFDVSHFGSLTSPLSDVYDYFDYLPYIDDTGNEYTSRKVHPDGEDLDSESTSVSASPLLLDSNSPMDAQRASAATVHKDFDHIIGDECEAPSSLYVAQDVETEAVDFESNGLLWLPPEPEDEEDDQEALFIEDDDDEIENAAGEWGYFRNSGSFGSGVFRSRDKSNEEHKRAMKTVLDGHFRALVTQLLQVENIFDGDENDPGSWLEIITSLSWEAATMLKPDMSTGGQMDPGGYVKVKCLASGHRSESMVVKGVVCKKNVAHRRMASKFEKSRLLILGGALEYQRVSTALSSIDTLLQQEMDHLKMAVAKIDAHRPDVLLVEKSVSRFAQEYLLAKDISLVLNIKRPLLERIARCTGGQIVPSIDHLSSPKLGHCDMFHVEKFLEEHGSAGQSGKKLVKTLMYFEGCPKPLGCTIILKGANGDELKKVKHVVQYGVFAAYHLALETSFLADEGASLPVLPLETPITVALPDKSSNVGRSISTVPGFKAPGSEKSVCEPRSLNTSPISYIADATVAFVKENEYGKASEVFEPLGDHGLENTGCEDFLLSSESDRLATEGVSRIINDLRDSPAKAVESDGDFDRNDLNLPSVEKRVEQQPSFKEEFPASSSDNQSILVSLSSRCVWKGTVCERAHLFRIKYYGNFDKPLGRFLRDDLFDEGYRCQSCDMPAEAHIQCYIHWQGTLTISVKKMQEVLLPGEKDGKIWMWHRCLKCPRTNGFPPATQRVVMSDAAWGLSFGKFLELSFSNHAAASRVASCGHSLHRDCLRFYGFGKMVACFRYASINVHSVYLPPAKLDFNLQSREWIEKEMNELVARGDLLFSEVRNILSILVETKSNEVVESKCHLVRMETLLQKEKAEFEESLSNILNQGAKKGEPIFDILKINQLRRQLVFQAYVWDQRLVNEESRMNTKQVNEKSGETFGSSPIIASDAEISQSPCHSEVPNTMAPICSPDAPLSVESTESFQGIVIAKNDYVSASLQISNSSKNLDSIEDTTSWLGMSFTNFYRSLNKNFTGSAQKLDTIREYSPMHLLSFQETELQGGARFLLPVGVDGMVVPVYDDELTSVISYVLLSPSYRAQVLDKTTEKSKGFGPDPTFGVHSGGFQLFNSLDESALESFKGFGSGEAMLSLSSSGTSNRSSLPSDPTPPNLHPRVSFADNGPLGKVKYSVTCYYAKQFRSLRNICCPSETDFVRSLSRCKKWGAQGGKSQVFFAKTLDDRFIIKQVTKTELESFLKFGTRYFHYLTESIETGSPTCLAKILGIYQIVSKHLKGGKETKMDMLVMENLLFGRNVTRVYDLKGSTRSRYNPDSSGGNKVLLDQNLIEAMPTSPIFVGSKAKRILERAVWNDTAFLASIDVMDYSLLVGVDSENQELVLGIIDFMRQYTWDKHLETWVKASGILGGSKNAPPTVISPKQYKTRFRKAMTTYFLMVPDQWSPPTIIPSKSQTDLHEALQGTATPSE